MARLLALACLFSLVACRHVEPDSVDDLRDATVADLTASSDLRESSDGATDEAADAAVHALGTARSHDIDALYWGLNVENFYASGSPSWTDTTSESVIASSSIAQLRFPGGGAANYWDWQTGWFWPGYSPPPTTIMPALEDTLASFSSLTTATSASPLYVLDVMTYQAQIISTSTLSSAIANQVAMLQAASELGLPVESLELGNEFYLGQDDYMSAFTDGTAYGNSMNSWITSLRQAYPKAKLAVVGALYAQATPRRTAWNQEVLASVKGADAMTLHRYDILGSSGLTADAVLASAFANWTQNEAMFVQPIFTAGLPIWITEFDIDDTSSTFAMDDYAYYSTWLQALYVGTMVLQFLEEPAITKISYYNLDSDRRHSIYFDAVYTINGQTTVAGALTASGQALALLGRAFKGATSTSSLTLSGVPQISPSTGETSYAPYPALVGVQLGGGASAQIVLINLSASATSIDLSPVSTAMNVETITAASPTTVITSSQSVTRTVESVRGSYVMLPPYSLNRIY